MKLEKKIWFLEKKDKSPCVVFFDNPITIGEAWSIWRKHEDYAS